MTIKMRSNQLTMRSNVIAHTFWFSLFCPYLSNNDNMPTSSSSQVMGTSTSVVIAIIGLFFFTRKVVRAKAVGAGVQSASASRGRRDEGSTATTAFAVGLLDIAIPREDRAGGSFARVMINDACISQAMQEVTSKLVICLRDADSMPAGRVRAYISGLYQEVYDAAYAAKRPHLDVRILLPKEAASSGGGARDASTSLPPVVPTSVSNVIASATGIGAGGGGGLWSTQETAAFEPDLEVLLSDQPQAGEHVAALNARRIKVGFSGVRVISLKSIASKAYREEYFYAEDATSNIPAFINVACGGTFDRLHGGHKKLLTLAASMCPGGTLTVGVTSDEMLKNKSNVHLVASLPDRLEGVREFLRTLNPHMKTRVEEITDPFGPPVAEEAFDAIVVSSETVAGAEKINELRAQKGFRPLAVAVTRRLSVATLSSTFLRKVAGKKQPKPSSSSGSSRKRKG